MNHADPETLHRHQIQALSTQVDRVFAVVMILQAAACVVLALVVSPRAWEGASSGVHPHVWGAMSLGIILGSAVGLLAWQRPGHPQTRHVVAAAQMLFSALLIHLCGGRVETHFHIFASLGFLALYRDWTVIVTATLVAAVDHVARGLLWPLSIFGASAGWLPDVLRALEHAGWVLFADAVLIWGCVRAQRDGRLLAEAQAADTQRQQALLAAVVEDARTLVAIGRRIATVADGLDAQAAVTASAAQEARTRATALAENMTVVADRTSQMNHAIAEVARSAAEAARIAGEAKSSSMKAGEIIAGQSQASQQITQVAASIRSIADQTRLLALNASIEAASAGDAGRGFAVVANEVKMLAQQTEEATTRVTGDVDVLQTGAAQAAAGMEQVSATVMRIDEAAQSIAAAVEEQSATTQDIAGRIAEAAQGGQAITATADALAGHAERAAGSVAGLRQTLQELETLAAGLERRTAG